MRAICLALALFAGCVPDEKPPAARDTAEVDGDGDGVLASEGDCDDADATVFPGADETCDGRDEDCDGTADDGLPDVWYADADADGYGDPSVHATTCVAPAGFVEDATDCDDADTAVHPGADETCDGRDEDCDDAVDEGLDATWYADTDGDGFGDPDAAFTSCAGAPDGTVANAEDCDDSDAAINPAAAEVCDAADTDEDCDGLADDADPGVTGTVATYADADGDGFGDGASATLACDGSGVSDGTDCDDGDAAINPAAAEVCDSLDTDEDCDGLADDADPDVTGTVATYTDADGDGFGDPASVVWGCDGSGVSDATDCDDTDATTNSAAAEICDAADSDEDCDGLADDADPDVTGTVATYTDADGDGYGDAATARWGCDGAGVVDGTDCDDVDTTINPGAAEVCDATDTDEDCDGLVNEADPSVGASETWYADTDGDGHGDPASATVACSAPAGTVADAEDCDDTEPLAWTGAEEVCGDGVDNDCDGEDAVCRIAGTYAAGSADLVVTGATGGAGLGAVLAVADLDGDGTGDLVGAPGNRGSVDLWYGPVTTSGTDAATASAFLSTAGAWAIARGDVDADGFDDLVLGEPDNDTAYLVYGGSRRAGTASLAGSADATWTAEVAADGTQEELGAGLAAGDLDGDGYDDFVLGAPGDNGSGGDAGAAYLVYGGAAREAGTGAVTGADAIVRGDARGDGLGYSLAVVEDVDGDGLDELLLGAPQAGSDDEGAALLFLGSGTRASGTLAASAADATWAGGSREQAGFAVYGLGDADGDGYWDVGVFAPGYDASTLNVGALQIYFGASALPSSAAARIEGTASNDEMGWGAAAWDADGDGQEDVIVGSMSLGSGSGYLFDGPIAGALTASDADATFESVSANLLGRAVAEPGDLTGDGIDDFVFGAPNDSTTVAQGGAIYVWAGLGGGD